MSAPEYSVRLRDVFPVPNHFDALLTSLDDILDQIGLTGTRLVINPPVLPPGDITAEPPLDEAAALKLLEYFEGEDEVVPPVTVGTWSVIPAAVLNQGNRVLTLQLKALSDIVVELPGIDGVSLVINPGGFEASLALEENDFSLAVTVSAARRRLPSAVQNSAGLVRPAGWATSSGSGGSWPIKVPCRKAAGIVGRAANTCST